MKTKITHNKLRPGLSKCDKKDYIYSSLDSKRGSEMYRIETTDPITGNTLEQLVNMPYVIEQEEDDSLVIYFESEYNRDLYLQDPDLHEPLHQKKHRS